MWWFHSLIVATVLLQFVNFWVLSQGKLKLSYYLLLVIYSGLVVVEVTLALRDSADQWSVGLYVLVDLWAIAMAASGLRRMRKTQASRGQSKHENS